MCIRDSDSESGTVDMSASNITLNQIVNTGGPGIYISLSCSEYFAEFPDGRSIDHSPNSPDLILTSNIDQAFQTVGAINREQWDIFTRLINYSIKRSRGLADNPPSSTTLLEDSRVVNPGSIGPLAVKRRINTMYTPAATAQLRQAKTKKTKKTVGGKRRKTRKKRKTKSRKRKTKRRKRKTKRKRRKANKK